MNSKKLNHPDSAIKQAATKALRRLRLELLEGRSLLAGDLLSCSVTDVEQMEAAFEAATLETFAFQSESGESELRWTAGLESSRSGLTQLRESHWDSLESLDPEERKRQRDTLLDIGSLRAEGEESPNSSESGPRVGARMTPRSFAISPPSSIAGPQVPTPSIGGVSLDGEAKTPTQTPNNDHSSTGGSYSRDTDYTFPPSSGISTPTQSESLTPDNRDAPLSSLNLRAFGSVAEDVSAMRIESTSLIGETIESQFDASLFAPSLASETLEDPTSRSEAYPSRTVPAKYVPQYQSENPSALPSNRDTVFGHLFSNQDSAQLRELDSLLKSLTVPTEAVQQGDQTGGTFGELESERNLTPSRTVQANTHPEPFAGQWKLSDDGMMSLDLPSDLLPTEPSGNDERLTAWNSPIGIYRPDSLGVAQGGTAVQRDETKSEDQRGNSFASQVASEFVTEGLRPIIAATSVALGAILFGHRKQKQRDAELRLSHQKLQ